MKKPIKIDEELILLRELADLAFHEWDLVDREYPPASYERWIKARKEFEEARNKYYAYQRTQVSVARASRAADNTEASSVLQEDQPVGTDD